jgi:anti-sigma factor RsiW
MECWSVRQRVSAYLDDAVSAEEGRLLERHLNTCRECTVETERYFGLREKLRALPRLLPPPELTTRLRVAASKIRMESASEASRWKRWLNRLELSLRHLMRPLALPAVGGLCSAIFLFSTLVPTFKSAFAMSGLAADVPTMLVTEPMLKDTAPVAFADGDAVVDLQLDDRGTIINYTSVSAPGEQSEKLRHSIENSLLFTEFWPATTFGRPVAGTIRISFHNNSRIDVRG